MKTESHKEIIIRFIKAINEHNLKEISDLMPDDHTFIDGMDNKTTGKKEMVIGWESYFDLFPDYQIEISEIIEYKSEFALFGYASATYKQTDFWRIPAAWKGIVENDMIKHWQVYCDYSYLLSIMAKDKKN